MRDIINYSWKAQEESNLHYSLILNIANALKEGIMKLEERLVDFELFLNDVDTRLDRLERNAGILDENR
jgi:hypothetical protein